MYNLFLDDERFPKDVTWLALPDVEWVIVRSQPEFEAHVLAHGMPDTISFDNDLGPADTGVGEGYWCVKWLVDQLLDETIAFNPRFTFTVHSKNNVAATSIKSYLNQYLDFRRG